MITLVLVTLNSPLGANVGPIINLTANVGTVVPNVASTTQLLAGLIVEVDVLATEITMSSEGICQTALMLEIPTPTTTTTTSTSIIPIVGTGNITVYSTGGECTINISNITFNGISVIPSVPFGTSNNYTILVTNPGTATLVVTTTGPAHSVTLTDSNGTISCMDPSSPFTFTGVVIDDINPINIRVRCTTCPA